MTMPETIYKISLEYDQYDRAWSQISTSTTDFIDSLQKISDEQKKVLKEGQEELMGTSAAYKSLQRDAEATSMTIMDRIKTITKYYGEYRQTLEQTGGLHGAIGTAMPQQLMGIQTAVSQFKGTLLADVPFGGLIGLMFFGGKRDEDLRAASTQAMRMFVQTGEVGKQELVALQNEAYKLGNMLGIKPPGMFSEFQAAAAGFVESGIKSKDTMKEVGISIIGARDDVLTASLAFDAMFKLASGTGAKAMGQVVRDFNLDTTESTRVIMGMGFAARDAGTNVMAFMNSVMSSAAALRTQRVDITEVAEAQLKLTGILREQLNIPRREYAAAYAERAVQQISSGLAGMSVGLSAVLGERISARMGRPVEGLEAMYAMREGFGGAGQTTKERGMFALSVEELGKLAKEQGRTFSEQRFFLEKLIPGISTEGSRAILAVAEDTKRGVSLQDAMKVHQKEIEEAFKNRAAEQSKLARAALKMQEGIAEVSSGLLAAVVTGFKAMGHIGMMLVEKLAHPFTDTHQYKIHQYYADRLGKQADVGINRMMAGLEGPLFSGIRKGLEVFGAERLPSEREVAKILKLPTVEYEEESQPGIMGAIGGLFSKRRFVKRESVIGEFIGNVSEQLEEQLKEKKVSGAQIRRILDVYQREEARTTKGEEAVSKVKGVDVAEMARAIEAKTMEGGVFTDPEGNEWTFKAYFNVERIGKKHKKIK